jgi:cytochrome b subunit of formate dehydrogenase
MRNTRELRILVAGAALVVCAAISPVIRARPRQAASADEACLACHGQPDLKSAAGQTVFVDPAKHRASVHANLPCTACHTDIKEFPHPKQVSLPKCATCHVAEASDVGNGIHAALGDASCTSCHGSAHDAKAAATITPKLCGTCHSAELKDFLSSIHGAAMKSGDPQGPTCQSCHGVAHKILTAQDPASPVAKKNLPATCATCHEDPMFLAKHQIPFAHPVKTYEGSVHGRALAAGNLNAASCSDCHSAHAIYPAKDSRSTVNHWNVPKTCATCHGEIAKIYAASIHGQAVAQGAADAPVCTDCHGDHAILAPSEAQSLVNPARVSLVTCGRCHGDTRLVARYNLPADRVPTFSDSFHGLASRAGSQSVANCASCHGVHNIFPSSDPRSTVNPANLAHTCGACHAGAGKDFAIGPVHVAIASRIENPVVRWIRRIYWVLIPFTLGFMVFHHSLDFGKKFKQQAHAHPGKQVQRMNLNFRIAHWLTVISFPILVITGFALKYPEAWWARPMLIFENRFAFRGTVHRIAAVVLLGSVAYHLIHLSLVKRDRANWREMIPSWKDARDLGDMLLYNLGWSDVRPTFGRFNYVEKIEYLAFMWGTAVMAVTGFVLWFNGPALRYLPKWVSDAATALHFYEAILATCAIAVWHMYTVAFDPEVYPMDRAWLTGKTSAEHLRNTRPEYYAEIIESEEADETAHETWPEYRPELTPNDIDSDEVQDQQPPAAKIPSSSADTAPSSDEPTKQ